MLRWWVQFIENDPDNVVFWKASKTSLRDEGDPVIVANGFKVPIKKASEYMKESDLDWSTFNGDRVEYDKVLIKLGIIPGLK
jgi:hypothetical protein